MLFQHTLQNNIFEIFELSYALSDFKLRIYEEI